MYIRSLIYSSCIFFLGLIVCNKRVCIQLTSLSPCSNPNHNMVSGIKMAELAGLPIPSMDWHSPDAPQAFKKFKARCELYFSGPLKEKSEEEHVVSKPPIVSRPHETRLEDSNYYALWSKNVV